MTPIVAPTPVLGKRKFDDFTKNVVLPSAELCMLNFYKSNNDSAIADILWQEEQIKSLRSGQDRLREEKRQIIDHANDVTIDNQALIHANARLATTNTILTGRIANQYKVLQGKEHTIQGERRRKIRLLSIMVQLKTDFPDIYSTIENEVQDIIDDDEGENLLYDSDTETEILESSEESSLGLIAEGDPI